MQFGCITMKASREKLLVRELKRGNTSAFEELYLEYHPRLYGFSLKLTGNPQDAEGMTQDAFMAIWENREKLDEERSFSGLIFRIARNKFLNNLKHKVTRDVFLNYLNGNGDHNNDLRLEVEASEIEEAINKSVNSFPERTREIFMLSRYRGLKYKEIAMKLNLSENVVDHEIRKALNTLKDNLSGFIS